MKNLDLILDGVALVGSVVMIEGYLQIISLSLAILASLVSLSINIAKWWKKAKKDGKIDSEELEELDNIIKEGKEECQNLTKHDQD